MIKRLTDDGKFTLFERSQYNKFQSIIRALTPKLSEEFLRQSTMG